LPAPIRQSSGHGRGSIAGKFEVDISEGGDRSTGIGGIAIGESPEDADVQDAFPPHPLAREFLDLGHRPIGRAHVEGGEDGVDRHEFAHRAHPTFGRGGQ